MSEYAEGVMAGAAAVTVAVVIIAKLRDWL